MPGIDKDFYKLMHKDSVCGTVRIETSGGALSGWKSAGTKLEPFLGNATLKKMKIWWIQRAVPGSRRMMESVIRKAGCLTSYEYLAKNLALSMTDCYWLCPIDEDLHWKDVSLHKQAEYNEGKLPYHNATSYDPNATLGGQMEKYWDLNEHPPMLVKTASTHFGQQAVNEAMASMIHKRQDNNIPFVQYGLRKSADQNIQSGCHAFTNENVEFVPAYEIVESAKKAGSVSGYDFYISTCTAAGIDWMQEYMDYLTLSDFVITNTDEHLLNFGVLRDSDSGRLTGPAPIFDSGNSMLYADDDRTVPPTRAELLSIEITGFHRSEERMLSHVKNKDILRVDLLPDKSEVMDFYTRWGIPETKARVISETYDLKCQMLDEFQHGKKISLYHEKEFTEKPHRKDSPWDFR
ncbi:MAG: hypothetical protein IJ641_03895 [Lachnospiraceae bacterium]|nr:hypothetical protein [Lachnospiraceae bacterium]